MTDHAKIASILRNHLNEWIAEDRARWLATPANQCCYYFGSVDGEESAQTDLALTQHDLHRERLRLPRRDFGDWDELIEAIIEERGLAEEDRPELAFGLHQTWIKVLEARLRRLQGEDDGTRS